MTWSGLCSESVLQLRLRERGISHKFVLTIRLMMMMSYGMRHYNQKSVPGIFVLVLFFFSSLPVVTGAFAFLVCGFLVPRSVLGS